MEKDHICDNNCGSCSLIDNCKFSEYNQYAFDIGFDVDVANIDWDNIPEEDIEPEVSSNYTNSKSTKNDYEKSYKEIEIEAKKEELKSKASSRALNEFLKKLAARLLCFLLVAIILLYATDVFLKVKDMPNSDYADRLFTLFQTIILTTIGYLLGKNQEKN